MTIGTTWEYRRLIADALARRGMPFAEDRFGCAIAENMTKNGTIIVLNCENPLPKFNVKMAIEDGPDWIERLADEICRQCALSVLEGL